MGNSSIYIGNPFFEIPTRYMFDQSNYESVPSWFNLKAPRLIDSIAIQAKAHGR